MAVSVGSFYLEVKGKLTPLSPLCIGSGTRLSLRTDAPVLRFGKTGGGEPYIPGSSLRGVLRAHLWREYAALACERDTWLALFGYSGKHGEDEDITEERDEHLGRGRLRIFDALPLPGSAPILAHIQDHVRISGETGAAAEGAKFDVETVLPYGDLSFGFRAVYEGDSATDDELILLGEALRALADAELPVGGKSAIGHGRVRLTSREYRTFQRSEAGGFRDFLRLRTQGLAPPVLFTFPASKAAVADGELPRRHRLRVHLAIQCNGPVLIKSPKTIKTEPYALYLKRPVLRKDGKQSDQAYIPGSSLRGVLRHRADLICQSQRTGCKPFETLFGAKKSEDVGNRGLLSVGDGEIKTPKEIASDHVAVDRLTHAAAQKFDNLALASPAAEFELRLSYADTPEEKAAAALFLLLMRDLQDTGRRASLGLKIGSQTTRGYGGIESATVKVEGERTFAELCAVLDSAWQGFRGKGRPAQAPVAL